MGFSRFFSAVLRDEAVPMFGDGRQTRDFTFVADAVTATIAAATRGRPGAVYNIGGGSRVELLDVFELIRLVTGKPLRVERLEAQRGDMRDTYAETTRARTDLAFAPTVTLEQGLRAQYEWMLTTDDRSSR
jgi:UDP-glucose 4-epimerase